MATLMDIAREAGVSKMTVSNALRGKSNVSETTRRRIFETAHRLNYRTNLAARALSSGRNGIIQLIVQDLDSPFYSRLAKELSLACERSGAQMLIRQSLYSEETEKNALRGNHDLFCDGLILATPRISAIEAKKLAQHRPLLLIDDGAKQPVVPTMNTPNRDGAHKAMTHLIERGVRSPLLLGAPPEYLSGNDCGNNSYYQRFLGAFDALSKAGIGLAPYQCVPTDWTFADARKAVHHVLANGIHFDGIFGMSDSVALGAIRGLADTHISVPQQVKVTGFDGATIGAITTPSLTTVEIDMAAMASTIIERISAKLSAAEDEDSSDITIDTAPFHLRIRESTGERCG